MGDQSLSRDTTSYSRGHYVLQQGTHHVHIRGVVSIEVNGRLSESSGNATWQYIIHKTQHQRLGGSMNALRKSSFGATQAKKLVGNCSYELTDK